MSDAAPKNMRRIPAPRKFQLVLSGVEFAIVQQLAAVEGVPVSRMARRLLLTSAVYKRSLAELVATPEGPGGGQH